jgi:small subunit ribosomal protein S17
MEDKNKKNISAEPRTLGKIFSGKIVSNKMKDTVVVLVERYTKHPKYGKSLKRQKKFKAHDVGNTHKEGEIVEIKEVKPISKDKRFIVLPVKQSLSGGEI